MKERGFTLVETIAVFTMIGIIFLVVSVNLNSSSRDYMVATAAEQLAQELRTTRSEALARNTTIEFEDINGNNLYNINILNGMTRTAIKAGITLGTNAEDIDLTFLDFQGVGRQIIFHSKGGITNCNSGASPRILVERNGVSRSVFIEPGTGFIKVQ